MNTDTVIVGCKLPNGLHLEVKNKDGEKIRVTVAGANASRIIGGYGLTPNVPAEFMSEWFKRNARHPAVIGHNIFIHADEASARDIAKERAKVETGLEGIDPVKRGMLNNENGEIDRKALSNYEKSKAENPRRNAQIQE